MKNRPFIPYARRKSPIGGLHARQNVIICNQSLQNRWDRLRASLDRLLTERGADMAEASGGSTELLIREPGQGLLH
jgi:hypothetical protein